MTAITRADHSHKVRFSVVKYVCLSVIPDDILKPFKPMQV